MAVAYVNGRLFVRGKDAIYCHDLRKISFHGQASATDRSATRGMRRTGTAIVRTTRNIVVSGEAIEWVTLTTLDGRTFRSVRGTGGEPVRVSLAGSAAGALLVRVRSRSGVTSNVIVIDSGK
jgi:hypothetical protein